MEEKIVVETSKKQELIDITKKVEAVITRKKEKKGREFQEGVCHVFAEHATAAILINENADPNIGKDFLKAINRAIPENNNYQHDRIDNNAAAHIKSALIGPGETIPIKKGKLKLGRWQSVMLAELDGPRKRRTVRIKIIEE